MHKFYSPYKKDIESLYNIQVGFHPRCLLVIYLLFDKVYYLDLMKIESFKKFFSCISAQSLRIQQIFNYNKMEDLV